MIEVTYECEWCGYEEKDNINETEEDTVEGYIDYCPHCDDIRTFYPTKRKKNYK